MATRSKPGRLTDLLPSIILALDWVTTRMPKLYLE